MSCYHGRFQAARKFGLDLAEVATSAHVGPSGFTICTAGLEHIFWQKNRFLRNSYLSFGKSETIDFCFAKSPDLQVGVFRCGTSPSVCRERSGQVLLPLPVWCGQGMAKGTAGV